MTSEKANVEVPLVVILEVYKPLRPVIQLKTIFIYIIKSGLLTDGYFLATSTFERPARFQACSQSLYLFSNLSYNTTLYTLDIKHTYHKLKSLLALIYPHHMYPSTLINPTSSHKSGVYSGRLRKPVTHGFTSSSNTINEIIHNEVVTTNN